MRSLLVLLLLSSSACTGTSAATDAGSRQDASSRADSGPRDGGNGDGGGGDAGYDAYIPFPPPPPPPCDAMSVFMGDPTMSVDVGLFDASSLFVPVADGATMPTQWGVQGGTMIIPVIALDASLPQASLCARVELVNRPDPAFPDNAGELAGFAGLTFDVMFVRREGRLISDGIQDQIGWSDPAGVRMILDVIVRGPDFAAQTTLHLELDSAGAPPFCDPCPG